MNLGGIKPRTFVQSSTTKQAEKLIGVEGLQGRSKRIRINMQGVKASVEGVMENTEYITSALVLV